MTMSDAKEKMPVSGIIKRILLITLIVAFVGIIVWVIVAGSIKGDDNPEISDREYNEAEVSLAARDLLEKSIFINDIFWYDGIPTGEDQEGVTLKAYKRADKAYLEDKGITLFDDIKKLTRGVFSESKSEDYFRIFLAGSNDESFTGVSYYIPEYLINTETGERKEIGILVSDKRAEDKLVKIGEKTEYDYDSIKVIASEGERVKIEVKCTVTTSDGKTQTRTENMYLIEEDDGWKLDSFSKIAYLEEINLSEG